MSMHQYCKIMNRLSLRFCTKQFLRNVYSGPEGIPDYTKIPAENGTPSWEHKKLRNVRQRVIDNNKSIKHKGDDKFVDDEHRKISSLSHMIFTDNPEKYKQDDEINYVLGQSKPIKQKDVCKVNNIDPDYASPDVQEVLFRLQGKSFDRIFNQIHDKHQEMPRLRLLTEEQLQEELKVASRRADELLEMPPVLTERVPIDDVLAEDSDLDGYEHSNVVFMDISEDLRQNDRFIVVREPNGKLRKAFWDERDRMLQTFYTKKGRTIAKPEVFDNLQQALEQKIHLNILEQLVVQYEPDAAQYISVAQRVYDDINENNLFDLLRSTRFFGGLAFYLTKYKTVDNLLLYFMNENLISESSDVVLLHSLLKPQSVTASKFSRASNNLQKIEAYISSDATNKAALLEAFDVLKSDMESRFNQMEEIS